MMDKLLAVLVVLYVSIREDSEEQFISRYIYKEQYELRELK